MTTYKRIDGDYVIATINPEDEVFIDTRKVNINGNLDVVGNLTYINVSELNVTDPFIVVNASNTATYASNSGILTHITSSTYAGIRYDAGLDKWQISSDTGSSGDTGTWANLVTGTGVTPPGGADTNVQFNDGGVFGGSGNLTFNKTTNALTISGYQVYSNIGTAPGAVANSTVIYGAAQGTGGTGIYAQKGSNNAELVNTNSAILYSLIF